MLSFVRRESVGGLGRVHLPHPEIFQAVQPGHALLLDDGKFRLRVVEASDVRIDAEVMTSGMLGSRKGISLPDTVLPFGAMTEKDRADVDFAMSLGVAWIALSFVQRAEDIAEARKLFPRPRRRSWPRSRSRRRSIISRRSSISPTPSWWHAAISASRCRWRRSRACRSRSPARRATPASRWSSPPRCWNR